MKQLKQLLLIIMWQWTSIEISLPTKQMILLEKREGGNYCETVKAQYVNWSINKRMCQRVETSKSCRCLSISAYGRIYACWQQLRWPLLGSAFVPTDQTANCGTNKYRAPRAFLPSMYVLLLLLWHGNTRTRDAVIETKKSSWACVLTVAASRTVSASKFQFASLALVKKNILTYIALVSKVNDAWKWESEESARAYNANNLLT